MKANEIIVSRQIKNLGHLNSAFLIKKAAKKALEKENVSNCIVSAMLTDDEGIRKLNKEFRDVDKVTDVLSFPMGDSDLYSGKTMLGDILINVNRCQEQGYEFGHGYNHEIMYLTVHSVLHLLGYDHVDEGEMKKIMRNREKEIMGELIDV